MNTLYLVRHGENRANLTKEFSHRKIDYPLTSKGRLQAEQTAVALADKKIHEIYTSPLKRAIETAAIIAGHIGLDYRVMENFREINVGHLEELPVSAQVWAQHNQILDDWFKGKSETSFPGGEDYDSLWARMRSGIEQVICGKDGHNILIVSHGGIFTLTLKDLCPQVDVNWLRNTENHNCSISEIKVAQKNGRLDTKLVDWAAYDHLHGQAARLVPGTPELDEVL